MTSLINNTKNQHFISQGELRLNSIPTNRNRIYEFSLNENKKYEISMTANDGVKINRKLSFEHLFSFDKVSSKKRLNFELLFNQYETQITTHTESLLSKIRNNGDVTNDIFNIFIYKLLNAFRNPFCIKRTVSLLNCLANHHPTNLKLNRLCFKIINGSRPQQRWLSKRFGITEKEYERWLYILFMLFVPNKNGESNFLESLVKDLVFNPKHITNIFIFHYTNNDKSPLISDKSFIINEESEKTTAYSFNLSSNSFVSYGITNVGKTLPQKIRTEIARRGAIVTCKSVENSFKHLAAYNKSVVDQSAEHVYCSSPTPYGIINIHSP